MLKIEIGRIDVCKYELEDKSNDWRLIIRVVFIDKHMNREIPEDFYAFFTNNIRFSKNEGYFITEKPDILEISTLLKEILSPLSFEDWNDFYTKVSDILLYEE